jgi:hypothetical protein
MPVINNRELGYMFEPDVEQHRLKVRLVVFSSFFQPLPALLATSPHRHRRSAPVTDLFELPSIRSALTPPATLTTSTLLALAPSLDLKLSTLPTASPLKPVGPLPLISTCTSAHISDHRRARSSRLPSRVSSFAGGSTFHPLRHVLGRGVAERRTLSPRPSPGVQQPLRRRWSVGSRIQGVFSFSAFFLVDFLLFLLLYLLISNPLSSFSSFLRLAGWSRTCSKANSTLNSPKCGSGGRTRSVSSTLLALRSLCSTFRTWTGGGTKRSCKLRL